jgi:hypothetical protein
MTETSGKKLKRGRRKIKLAGRFGGRILPDWPNMAEKGPEKFKFADLP